MLGMSAKLLFSMSWYSSHRGSCQALSPARLAAGEEFGGEVVVVGEEAAGGCPGR